MSRAPLIVFLVLAGNPAWAQVTDGEVDLALARQGCHRTRQRGRVVSFECGADVHGEDDLTNLDRRVERASSPAERSRFIETFFGNTGMTIARELPRKQLRLILKPKAVLETENARARESGDPTRLVGVPWMGDLVIVPVVDTPTSQTYVTRELTKRWKTSMEEVRAIASQNLDALDQNPSQRNTPEGRMLAAYESNDGYDAARVLSERGRKAVEKLLGGAALYAVPRRDLLLAVRRDDPDAIAELRKLAAADHARDYPLSDRLFVFDGNRPRFFDERKR